MTTPIINLTSSRNADSPKYQNLIKEFQLKYNSKPNYIIRVPGRVNLIGEHIDYCGYAVLPMAMEQDILMAMALNRDDNVIRLANCDSTNYPSFQCPTDQIEFILPPKWHHYFLCGYKGIIEKLKDTLKDYHNPGINVLVLGDLPASSGLSSSSAMVCSSAFVTLMAVKLLTNNHDDHLPLDKLSIADLCAKVEHYIGTDSGGMDQAIAILAEEGQAKLIEFQPKLSSQNVKLPQGVQFYVSHSGVTMNKAATANYNIRVAETRLAGAVVAKVAQIKDYKLGDQLYQVQKASGKSLPEMVPLLKQVFDTQKPFYTKQEIALILGMTTDDIDSTFLSRVSDKSLDQFKLYQRALHVYEEAERVYRFKQIANDSNQADVMMLGQLMSESHLSCKDLYDCSHDKLDELVEVAMCSGALGSRLTGAGWGGCIVSLVPDKKSQEFESKMNTFSKFNCKSKPSQGAVIYKL